MPVFLSQLFGASGIGYRCKMLHREFEAPEVLRDIIKCFWYTRLEFGDQLSSFTVMPDGSVEIIFYFGSPCSISCNGGWEPLPSPFIVGLLDQPAIFNAKKRLDIMGIRCFPWTAFELLGLPSGSDGVRAFEHPIAQLQSTISSWIEADRIDEAVAQVRQYFLHLQSPVAIDDTLLKAGSALLDTNGAMPVSQVAAAAHATVRTLERKFKQSSGHSVKDVSDLMRFEQVRNHLWLYPNSSIARLAHEFGYTDQSHLSKEFKRYSGTTPAAFARKAKEEGRV